MCVRHLYENYKKPHAGLALKNKLWSSARAKINASFKQKMDESKVMSEAAWAWLDARPAKNQSKSQFKTFVKIDMLLNDMCVCFNSCIMNARDKPIITMFQKIRLYLMRRVTTKRVQFETQFKPIGLRISQIIEKLKDQSTGLHAEHSREGKFQFQLHLQEMTTH